MRNEEFKDLIFYEIYPTSFFDSNNDGVGDINGITLKLDYIKELGFNALWINPFISHHLKMEDMISLIIKKSILVSVRLLILKIY